MPSCPRTDSVRPRFPRGAAQADTPIFWEHEGNRAIRAGKWKLVARYLELGELYDMVADRSETYDLAAEHPDLLRNLANRWNVWASSHIVDPWRKKLAGGVVRGKLDGGKGAKGGAKAPAPEGE